MEDQEQISHEALTDSYRALTKSMAWIDIVTYLDARREETLSEAEDNQDPQKAYGLLQKAQAYKTIKAYLDRMTSAPSDY